MLTCAFTERLLYGMDSELLKIPRQGSFLGDSGFQEDDVLLGALSTTTLTFTAPLDYEKFNR
ncbi:hypothetical protein JCM10295v2_005093 [Rhodotorula toruloides]